MAIQSQIYLRHRSRGASRRKYKTPEHASVCSVAVSYGPWRTAVYTPTRHTDCAPPQHLLPNSRTGPAVIQTYACTCIKQRCLGALLGCCGSAGTCPVALRTSQPEKLHAWAVCTAKAPCDARQGAPPNARAGPMRSKAANPKHLRISRHELLLELGELAEHRFEDLRRR